MQRYLALLVLALAAVVNAHFQLQYPPPRGVFVEDDEPNFCDGYKTPASNRSEFPLTGGFFTLNSEHPKWTAGVLVSGSQDPTSFSNFSQLVPFFQTEGEGIFCIPLDFSANANGTALKNGQNVTIQIVYSGGDGNLYQCADLTLSSNFKISSAVQCSNATSTSAANSTASSTTSAPAATRSAGAAELTVGAAGLMLSVFGITFLTL